MISHLLFANDCILFGEASKIAATTLKQILNTYEIVSGQCVNFDKLVIFFSGNVTEVVQKEVVVFTGSFNY